jgi:hypothetical protein
MAGGMANIDGNGAGTGGVKEGDTPPALRSDRGALLVDYGMRPVIESKHECCGLR